MSLIRELLEERIARNERLIRRYRQWPGLINGVASSELIRRMEQENRECAEWLKWTERKAA